jgi:hypothetical protein
MLNPSLSLLACGAPYIVNAIYLVWRIKLSPATMQVLPTPSTPRRNSSFFFRSCMHPQQFEDAQIHFVSILIQTISYISSCKLEVLYFALIVCRPHGSNIVARTPVFDKEINGLLWSHVNASLCHGDSPAPSRCLPFLELITMRFNPYPTSCQEKTQTTNDSVKGAVRPWICVYI